MKIIEQIEQAKASLAEARNALGQIGREVYEVRNGQPMIAEFRFSEYNIWSADGEPDDAEENCPIYPEGMRLITVHYYHKRWEDIRLITFPLSYLDEGVDYLTLERSDADKAKALREEQNRKRQAQLAETARAQRRQLYQKLREEFEGENT